MGSEMCIRDSCKSCDFHFYYSCMSPAQVGIKLNDMTSASELDSFFTRVWSQDRRVKIVLDATDCRKISVGRILSMKGVLDEHRYSSRKYIDHTIVLVNSRFARFILRMGLSIIKTERPVYIKQAPKLI